MTLWLLTAFFVAATGSDANPGTSWETAWRTLPKAAQTAQAGDVVTIRAGAYSNTQALLQPVNSGTAAAPITFRGEDGAPPTLQRTSGGVVSLRDAQYVVIENLILHGGPGAAVAMRNAHHNTVRDVTVTGGWRGVDVQASDDNLLTDLHVSGAREGIYIRAGSDRNTVQNSVITRNGNSPLHAAGDRCGLCLGEAAAGTDNRVIDVEVSYNGGPGTDYGLIAYEAPRTLILRARVHHNVAGGIMVTQYSHGSAVLDSDVWHNGYGATSNASAITVRNGSNTVTVIGNRVRDNRVAPGNPWGQTDPRGAIDVRGFTMTGVLVVDNVVTGTVGGPDYVGVVP